MSKQCKLNQREVLYGFVAWLTCREEEVKIGANHECGGLPDLIDRFAAANHLPDISEEWPAHLIHPSGEVAIVKENL